MNEKPMPQSPDAERAILGSILINNKAFYRVVDIVGAADFSNERHQHIFTVMCDLAEQSVEIDLMTIKDELLKRKKLDAAGGSPYISSLVDGIPDVANVERYAKIVKEKSTLRSLITLNNETMQRAWEQPDAATLLSEHESKVLKIAEATQVGGFRSITSVTRENLQQIEAIKNSDGGITGLDTGYEDVNRITAGWQKQDLIILAARPGMGKTALMLNFAQAGAIPRSIRADRKPYTIGAFSLEMSRQQLGVRLLSTIADVSSEKMRKGYLRPDEWARLAEASSVIAGSPLFIEDQPSIDILSLRAKARQLQAERGLDMIMVDYLQLVTVKGRSDNRNHEVSKVSSGLKALAKELDIPVMALAQLSRESEKRTGDHRPRLADLRESGSIEQDADIVMFIYRDEVYNKETPDKGIAELIFAKHRNGPLGDVKLAFIGDRTKFAAYAPPPAFAEEVA